MDYSIQPNRDAVGEMLEKALAYNICVTTRLRREAAQAAMTDSTPVRTAS